MFFFYKRTTHSTKTTTQTQTHPLSHTHLAHKGLTHAHKDTPQTNINVRTDCGHIHKQSPTEKHFYSPTDTQTIAAQHT